MKRRGKEPLQKLIQQMHAFEEMGMHEQAEQLHEEIMDRLRGTQGRGTR